MRYTEFWDMHSGGKQKTDYARIYIEAPEDAAIRIFERRFGRDPHNVTCDCCGDDYSVYEVDGIDPARGDAQHLIIDKCGTETILHSATTKRKRR